jgi:hypothetical protein
MDVLSGRIGDGVASTFDASSLSKENAKDKEKKNLI